MFWWHGSVSTEKITHVKSPAVPNNSNTIRSRTSVSGVPAGSSSWVHLRELSTTPAHQSRSQAGCRGSFLPRMVLVANLRKDLEIAIHSGKVNLPFFIGSRTEPTIPLCSRFFSTMHLLSIIHTGGKLFFYLALKQLKPKKLYLPLL